MSSGVLDLEAIPEAKPCEQCGTTKGGIDRQRWRYVRTMDKCRRCYLRFRAAMERDRKMRKAIMEKKNQERLSRPLGRLVVNHMRRERRWKRIKARVAEQMGSAGCS